MTITPEARRLFAVVMEKTDIGEKVPNTKRASDGTVLFLRRDYETSEANDAEILAAAALCAFELLAIGYVLERRGEHLWPRLEYNDGMCQRSCCCGDDIETLFAAILAEKGIEHD